MVEGASIVGVSVPIKKENRSKANTAVKSYKESNTYSYFDSFVKHAKKSTPTLLILTGIWTAIDKTSKNIPVKQSLKNNLTGFFAPVLVASSAILASIENKKSPENNK